MLKRIKFWNKKGGFLSDNLGWLLLAVAVLLIVAMGYVILSGRGSGALNYIKNLIRFR